MSNADILFNTVNGLVDIVCSVSFVSFESKQTMLQ